MTDTKGICCNFDEAGSNNLRLLLFEIDGAMSEVSQSIETVLAYYVSHRMDVFMHRTHNGFHFMSPTIITREAWKNAMIQLKHLNPRCPMVTLRIIPNKYPNESEIWFHGKSHTASDRKKHNSIEMCNFLNSTFHTHFDGDTHATPKRVVYQV